MSASREKKQRLDGDLSVKQRREMEEAKKARGKTVAYTIIGIICVIAVIALLIWNSNFFQSRTAAATVGDKTYTVADVSFYYNSAKNYLVSTESSAAQYFGGTATYDSSLPASEQQITEATVTNMNNMALFGGSPFTGEVGQTFEDYFRQQALDSLQEEAMLSDAAKAANYTLSADGQKQVEETISRYKQQASNYGYTLTSYLRAAYGPYMTQKVFKEHVTNSTLASEYAKNYQEGLTYTAEQLDAYYQENAASLDSFDYRVAYIAGSPETETDADGATIDPTEEEKAAALADANTRADAMAEAVKGGADFNETAKEYVAETAKASYDDPEYGRHTGDVGSSISSISYGTWIADSERKAGDVGVVVDSSNSGYYVVQVLDRWLAEDTYDTVDVRHILVKAETGSAEGDASPAPTATPSESAEPSATPAPSDSPEPVEPTQEQLDAAKARIEEIKAEWEAGDKTSESFGALADQYSEDPGSNGTSVDNGGFSGGLYQGVTRNRMSTGFNDWIFAAGRQVGDVGIVENTQQDQWGYHLIYMDKLGDIYWKAQAQRALSSDDVTAWMDGLKAASPAAAVEKGMTMLAD